MARSVCQACGQTFSGVTWFDAHRVGSFEVRDARQTRRVVKPNTRRCMTVQEMTARGLVQSERGVWGSGEKMPAGAFSGTRKRKDGAA